VLLIRRKKNILKNQWWKQFNKSRKHKPSKRAIHIHGGMEHNLVGYAINYSCGSTKISKGSDFTKKLIIVKEIFQNIIK
jgi:hypothetical protein